MKYIQIILLILVVSCSGKKDPTVALKDYINYRFSSQQKREELLSRTTGELYNEISTFETEELSGFINDSKYKKAGVKINLKKCDSPKEATSCYITYTLKYHKLDDSKKAYMVEVKKIARLIREDGAWKISRINDVKSFIKAKRNLEIKTPGEMQDPFESKN